MKITTPICSFVTAYAKQAPLRLHMPGHKGAPQLGIEHLDITEIPGADVLYQATGIIAESRENARLLYDTRATFYSTEGSSLCIRAMIYLAFQHAQKIGCTPRILAARNAHKSFLYAVGMVGIELDWLSPPDSTDILSCQLTPEQVEQVLSKAPGRYSAFYLTSPDYLGNVADTKRIAQICHRHHVLLLVDNAHGAYLHFLPHSLHPMSLGADLCCDSAHKTLPALTGAAYLHVGKDAPEQLADMAEHALSLFASTSPSYLILLSLDRLNLYLSGEYRAKLADFADKIQEVKQALQARGYTLVGTEPLKITICAKPYGYTGYEIAELLQAKNIVCEFSDPDYLVCMLTPASGVDALTRLYTALCEIPRRTPRSDLPPLPVRTERIYTIREALLAPSTACSVEDANGRILADAVVSCPPAIPILVCGERITEEAIRALKYYNIDRLKVLDA